jgi:hypothetical protein
MIYKSLVIGLGEVGLSLYNVLKHSHNVISKDIENKKIQDKIDVMHICFPYSKHFVSNVRKYKKLYNPKYTIIHSTVPIGTSKKCECFYSPIRGIHPHLENSLKVFVKYLAPKNKFLKGYFEKAGITIETHADTSTLEAMKLYCTTLYGLNIIAEKEIWDFCKKHKLDYHMVYGKSNITYNDGYKKLGFPQYSKYVLKHKDGKIGGHCVIPNCKLLNTAISKFIYNQNKKL